jgi:hypothetical protein
MAVAGKDGGKGKAAGAFGVHAVLRIKENITTGRVRTRARWNACWFGFPSSEWSLDACPRELSDTTGVTRRKFP